MVNSESMDSSGDGKPKDYVTQLNSGGISVDTHSPSPVTASSVRLRDMMDFDANESAADVTSTECANPVDSLPETAVTRTIDDEENIRLTTDILLSENQSSLFCSVPLVKVQDVLSSYSVDSQSGDEVKSKKLLSRRLLCLYCDRTFVTSNLRQKHVDRCHSVKQARRSSARFQAKFSTACIFCKRLNNTDHDLDDLFKHLVERHSNKYFACVPCEERFVFKSHLEEHNLQNHVKKTKASKEETPKLHDVLSGVIPDEAVEISTIKTKHKTKIKKYIDNAEEDEISNGPNLRMSVRKELRKKKVGVKGTKTGIKRNTRLQAKVTNAQTKSPTKKRTRPRNDKTLEPPEKSSSSINPYPTFDAYFRVKKITDHSIDNLKISSLTFDDVFDKAFYTRIKCNIQENLQNHIDGKLFKNEESESRISNFEKNKGVNPSPAENFGCDISLNAATPVISLLSSQLGEDLESQIEYGAKASKKKPPPKKDEVHYKYFTRRKYQASILENKENRDLSKLDMWTQLVVKDRQQTIINDQKTEKEKIEYTKGIEYRTKMQNAELNRILDRRGPFEDLKEEANKKAALEKYHRLGESVTCEAISDVTSILNDMVDRVFDFHECNLKMEEDAVEQKPEIADKDCEIPFYLNLQRNSSLIDQPDVDKSDRITLICSSQETENFEETTVPRDKNSLVELTGEWTRTRIYICAACGVKVPNIKLLIDHKSVYHQNVWVQHYEFVGNQSVLYKHLSIPGLGKVGYFEKSPMSKMWKRSDARLCTKCSKMCNTLGELHRHVLECGEDWSWMLARKKLKYRPFGAKSRRKRRGLVKRIIHKEKSGNEVREKKKYNIKRYEKPSDVETIQRMLANLPAKRATRKLICLKDGFPKQRKPSQKPNSNPAGKRTSTLTNSKKKPSVSSLKNQTLRKGRPGKKGLKCNPIILRKSVRNINKVFGSKILDTNSTLLVKRKIKNVLQHQRITRAKKMLIEEPQEVKSEEPSTIPKKKEGIMSKVKMLTKAVKRTVLKKEEKKTEEKSESSENVNKSLSKTVKNLKKSDSIEERINEIINSIGESDSNSDKKKDVNKSKIKAQSDETSSKTDISKKKPKLLKKESVGSKLVRTFSLRKLRKKDSEEERLKTQSNPELNVKTAGEKVKNGKRKSTLDSFKSKIKKMRLKDRNVTQIAQVDGSSQISDEILPFLEKIHINSDESCEKPVGEEANVDKEESDNVAEETKIGEEVLNAPLEIQLPVESESPKAHIEQEDVAVENPIETNNEINEVTLEPEEPEECDKNNEESVDITKVVENAKIDIEKEENSSSEQLMISSTSTEVSNLVNSSELVESNSQLKSDSESKIPLDVKMCSSKTKIKKRSKGLNDCIAMLTSKLQQKVEDDHINIVPHVPTLPTPSKAVKNNIIEKEIVIERVDTKEIDEVNVVKEGSAKKDDLINHIPTPHILQCPKPSDAYHRLPKVDLEKERQEVINLRNRYFFEQQQLFLQQIQKQFPLGNQFNYIPNIPKETSFLINNIMLNNQKEMGEKFLRIDQHEDNLAKLLGNFDKNNKFKEVDVNIEIDIMKCLGNMPENNVLKLDKPKSRNEVRKKQNNRTPRKFNNKKKENIDLLIVNPAQSVFNAKLNERLSDSISTPNTSFLESDDVKLKRDEIFKENDKVIDLKINKNVDDGKSFEEIAKKDLLSGIPTTIQQTKFVNPVNDEAIDLKIKKSVEKEKYLLEELSKNGLSISLFPISEAKRSEAHIDNNTIIDLKIKKPERKKDMQNEIIKNNPSVASFTVDKIEKCNNTFYSNDKPVDLIVSKKEGKETTQTKDKIDINLTENKVESCKIVKDIVTDLSLREFIQLPNNTLKQPAPCIENSISPLPNKTKKPDLKSIRKPKRKTKISKSPDVETQTNDSTKCFDNTIVPMFQTSSSILNKNDDVVDLKVSKPPENKEIKKFPLDESKIFITPEETPKLPPIPINTNIDLQINKKPQKKKKVTRSPNILSTNYLQSEDMKSHRCHMGNIIVKEKIVEVKIEEKQKKMILKPPQFIPQTILRPPIFEIHTPPKITPIVENVNIPQEITALQTPYSNIEVKKNYAPKNRHFAPMELNMKSLLFEEREPDVLEEKAIENTPPVSNLVKEPIEESKSDDRNRTSKNVLPASSKSDTDSEDDVPLASLLKSPKIQKIIPVIPETIPEIPETIPEIPETIPKIPELIVQDELNDSSIIENTKNGIDVRTMELENVNQEVSNVTVALESTEEKKISTEEEEKSTVTELNKEEHPIANVEEQQKDVTISQIDNKSLDKDDIIKNNKSKVRARKRIAPIDKKEKIRKKPVQPRTPKPKPQPLLEEVDAENGNKTARKIKISCQIFQRSSKIVLDPSKILNEFENEQEDEEEDTTEKALDNSAMGVINNIVIKQEQQPESVDLPVSKIKQELPEAAEEEVEPEPTLASILELFPEVPLPGPSLISVDEGDLELEIRRRIKLSNLQLKRENTGDNLAPVGLSTEIIYNVDSPGVPYNTGEESYGNVYEIVNVENEHEKQIEDAINLDSMIFKPIPETEMANTTNLAENVEIFPQSNFSEDPIYFQDKEQAEINMNLEENKMSESTYNIKINTPQNTTYSTSNNLDLERINTPEIYQIEASNVTDIKTNDATAVPLNNIDVIEKQIETNFEVQHEEGGDLPTEDANVTPNAKVLEEHKQTVKELENKTKKTKKKHEEVADITAYGEFQVNTDQTGGINKIKISRKKLQITESSEGITGDGENKTSVDVYVVKKTKRNHKKSVNNKERKRKKSSGSLKENQINDLFQDIDNQIINQINNSDTERQTNFLESSFEPIAETLLDNVEFEIQNEEIGRKLKINKKKVKDKGVINPISNVEDPLAIDKEESEKLQEVFGNVNTNLNVENAEISMTENMEDAVVEEEEPKDYDNLPKDMEIEEFQVDIPIIETQFKPKFSLPINSVIPPHALASVSINPVMTCLDTSSKRTKRHTKNQLFDDLNPKNESSLNSTSLFETSLLDNLGSKLDLNQSDYGESSGQNVLDNSLNTSFGFAKEQNSSITIARNDTNVFNISNFYNVGALPNNLDQEISDLFGKSGSINTNKSICDFATANSYARSTPNKRGKKSKSSKEKDSFVMSFDKFDSKIGMDQDLSTRNIDEVDAIFPPVDLQANAEDKIGDFTFGVTKRGRKGKDKKNEEQPNFENITSKVINEDFSKEDIDEIDTNMEPTLDVRNVKESEEISTVREDDFQSDPLAIEASTLNEEDSSRRNIDEVNINLEYVETALEVQNVENKTCQKSATRRGRKPKTAKGRNSLSKKANKCESKLVVNENETVDEVDGNVGPIELEVPTLDDLNSTSDKIQKEPEDINDESATIMQEVSLNNDLFEISDKTETAIRSGMKTVNDIYDFSEEIEFNLTDLSHNNKGKTINVQNEPSKETYEFKNDDINLDSKIPRKKSTKKTRNVKESSTMSPSLKLDISLDKFSETETISSINSIDIEIKQPAKKSRKSKNSKNLSTPTPTAFDMMCDELQALCDVPLELPPVVEDKTEENPKDPTTTDVEQDLNAHDLLNTPSSVFCDNVKTSCDAKIDELLKEISFSPKQSKKSKKSKAGVSKNIENEDVSMTDNKDSSTSASDTFNYLDNQNTQSNEVEDLERKNENFMDGVTTDAIVNVEELKENSDEQTELASKSLGQDEEEFEAPTSKPKVPRSKSPKKKNAKAKKETTPSVDNGEVYCDICNKMFARSENLIKHKRTLTHIAKLSEIEAKEAEAKAKDREPAPESEAEPEQHYKMDININDILNNSDKHCEQDVNEDIGTKMHINSPFVLNTNSDTLKLADIINDVLNKPVENEKHTTYSESHLSQSSNSLPKSEVKRYKSLGERKSFESDLKTTYPFNTMQINNDPIPKLSNPDTILKQQISILENIIETEGPFGYIDDITVSSNKSIEQHRDKSPSDLSIMSEAKQDDSNQLTFTQNTNMLNTLMKPNIHNEQFIKPTQYEEISNDSSTVRNQFDDQRSRKVLNRDEELFLECCSLLKSSSEVSGYSKRSSSKTVHVLNKFEMKQSDEPDWLERKNFATKSQEYRHDIFSNSCPNTPLGDGYGEDYSNTNSNTIATDWSTIQREQRQENPVFEDISLDSKASNKPETEQFKNSDKTFNDFHLFNSEHKKQEHDGCVANPTEENNEDREVDEEFKKKMVSRFGGLMAKAWKNSMQAVKKHKNRRKQDVEITQTSIMDYTVPLSNTKNENDLNDNKKLLTKGAMKVFEGLKVSIPTDDLDMKELLNNSFNTKKQEEELNRPGPEQPKEVEPSKEDVKTLKPSNVKSIGNKLGLKVTKKKHTITKASETSLPSTGAKDDDAKKGHDVYDFEETQDNTDIFNSTLPNIKDFRNQIAEKKSSEVNVNTKEPTSPEDPEESDNESGRGFIDSFSYEAQSLSSFSTESSSSSKKPKKKNITKKKCMIMGRIFKNAFKSKVEEDIRDIPSVDNSKLVEDYVLHLPQKDEKRTKLSEQEMDMLFDKLLEDKQADEESKKLAESQQEAANKAEKSTTSKTKPKLQPKRKRLRHNSDSTDDEFSLNKNKKRYTKKKQKNVDNAINLEQELKECIGVASRKSQRKCTSGKQNVLAEFWSSDDSNFEAFIRETAMDKPKGKDTSELVTDEAKEVETDSAEVLDSEAKMKEPFKELADTIKKATPKIELESQKVSNSSPNPANKLEKVANTKQARRKSVANIRPRTKIEQDSEDKKMKNVKLTAETLAANRRKRAASNTLYYWSSSSEDESQDLIEIKPVRDEVDEDEDRPMQHGWIVGDSPKKLVTMLAQAKGKKVDADSVKEQSKKRTTM